MIIHHYIQNSAHFSLQSVATHDEDKPQDFVLTCCKCNSKMQAANRILYQNNKFTSLPCKQCKAHTVSKRWLCSCNQQWYLCATHSPVGYKCRSERKKGQAPSTPVKRGFSDANALPSDIDFSEPLRCVKVQCLECPSDPSSIQKRALPALVEKMHKRIKGSQPASSSASHSSAPSSVEPVRPIHPEDNASRSRRGLKRCISDYNAIDRINRMRLERDKELRK